MFYDSGSRLRYKKTEAWIGSAGNQKALKTNQNLSASPTRISYFSHIHNTYDNDSKKIRIPFKYELNNTPAKISSNSPKSALNFQSKQNDLGSFEKANKGTQKNRKLSSSLNIRPKSATVKENVIKSLDITSYSFNLKKNNTIDLKINFHSKTSSKSDSQFSPKFKISSKKSDIRITSSISSDEYIIINKDIRDTFHSKNEMPKIKEMNADESIKQDFKNNFCLQIDDEKKKIDYYKQFLIMKFRNSENLSCDQNEKINCHDKNESKLLYELAYEEVQKNDDAQKSEVKYILSHAEIPELVYNEEEIMNIKKELIKKEEESNKRKAAYNKKTTNKKETDNNEEINKNKETDNNEEVNINKEINNNEEESNKRKTANNEETTNKEETSNNEKVNNNKKTSNNEEVNNNKETSNNEEAKNNKETSNNEEVNNNKETANNEETTNKEEVIIEEESNSEETTS